MKKYIALILALISIVGLVGCSSEKSFDITGASKIELRGESRGTAFEINDEEDIKHITDSINVLKFSKGESSPHFYIGRSYLLKWYDSKNNLIEEIVVLSEDVIDYKGHFYKAMKSDYEIDISLFDDILLGNKE